MTAYDDLRAALQAEVDESGAVTKSELRALLERFPASPVEPAPTGPPPVEPAPVEPPPSVYRPDGIAADGTVDVAAELTAWFRTVPDGAVADLGTGVYLCQTHVRLDDRTDLTIRGGTLLRTEEGRIVYPQANPHLWLVRPTRCKVEGLTVRGTNVVPDQRAGFGAYKVDHEFDAAVRLEHYTDCTVTGLDADGVWGDGIQWHVGTGAHAADCRIDRVGRQGVTLIGRRMLMERVRVEHGRRSGFDIEPDTSVQGVGEIEVRESYTNTIGLPFASGGRGPVDDVWLHHNTSRGGSVPILYVKASDGARRSNWRLESHTAVDGLGSPAAAVYFYRVDGVTVQTCDINISSSQGRQAVGLVECGGACQVTSNQLHGALYYYNRAPASGQSLSFTGNIPDLTEIA